MCQWLWSTSNITSIAASSENNLVSSQTKQWFQHYTAQVSTLNPFITVNIYTCVTGSAAHSLVPCSLCNQHSSQPQRLTTFFSIFMLCNIRINFSKANLLMRYCGKYGRAKQTADHNITRRTCSPCWITMLQTHILTT